VRPAESFARQDDNEALGENIMFPAVLVITDAWQRLSHGVTHHTPSSVV
jgi:hypothetical protein